MDTKFHPAMAAINAGDLEGLRALVSQDPTLATTRSSKSHPTLLQCLALAGCDVANNVEMAKVLVDTGAEINGPLVACASGNNVAVAAFLLDAGALINGQSGRWSPLEEALYWSSNDVRDLLLERGASIHNLRIAAGVGRVDLIEGFFDSDDNLRPEAGKIDWPFQNPLTSNSPKKAQPQATLEGWSHGSRNIINNAFVYACMHNQIDAARLLLQKGAELNVIPLGFDFAATGLHYAALNGHRPMAEFLIAQGADANIKDLKVGGTPAGWAEHGGHRDLKEYLEGIANR